MHLEGRDTASAAEAVLQIYQEDVTILFLPRIFTEISKEGKHTGCRGFMMFHV